MINEVIISRLDNLIGDFDTPFFNYLLYSYDLSLSDCEIAISKIKSDIQEDKISGDDNLVELIEEYFRQMKLDYKKQEKLEYLTYLMDENNDFYKKFLARYEVSPKDIKVIHGKVKSQILDDDLSDFEIKRAVEYYFSNAVKQKSYIRSLSMIVGKNYDTLIIDRAKKENPNIYDNDIIEITNEIYTEILEGHDFKSIKTAFLDKIMRKSESKKAEAISKWENLVLGNGDSFNKLLETKNLTISDGENIKKSVRSMILKGSICSDKINGAFLTKLCINYSSE